MSSDYIKNIRNFSIIAHIDHGKSTLADRIIEKTNSIENRLMSDRILDSMDLEKERGITIKSQTVRLDYTAKDGQKYILNLMDTPGHIDFSYEVSRCLAACDGSLLLVDATQGVEAQTLANVYKAIDNNHDIIPVLNKIDLPSSNIDSAKQQIEGIIGIDAGNAVLTSGKTGFGVEELLERIISDIRHPDADINKPLQILLVDAWYDVYLGVIMLIKVANGSIKVGDTIKMMSTLNTYSIERLGVFTPFKVQVDELKAGEVGFMCANVKNIRDCKVGDTVVAEKDTSTPALHGFKEIQPVVFCGIYPTEMDDYAELKDAMEKLALNDSSIKFEPETSSALGFGFRCGFLGLLHMDIVQERLDREYDMDIIVTAPSVVYKIYLTNGEMIYVSNPSDMPDPVNIKEIEEPIAQLSIFVPDQYVGDIIKLCTEKRGRQIDINYTGGADRILVRYDVPMSEIVYDFNDRLKSISKGYASFEWEIGSYEKADICKVSILINSDPVDALSMITHRSNSERRGRALCLKLKELIPRQMFAVPLQAAIGAKIVARETIPAMRKDVTSKCYGGDVSRKRKLLDKQKKGKKRMKMLGSVEVPQSAFSAVLSITD
jgi:GTP-binding protein LepA